MLHATILAYIEGIFFDFIGMKRKRKIEEEVTVMTIGN